MKMVDTQYLPQDPQESCAHILRAVRCSGLTWGTQETPYSLFLTIRKRYLKDAKFGPTARSTYTTLGVDKGGVEVEQHIGSIKEDQLKIQTLESGMRSLKSDLEEEVLNNEKLKTALAVSKSLVNNLNDKYSEAMDQATKSAKTLAEHDKTSKALKKAEEEIVRLTNKSNESIKIITKLRETTVPLDKYEKAFHNRHHLENELEEALSRVTLGEDEVALHKEKNRKLSKENTNLIVLLNNSKGSKEALEKQISDSNRASTSDHPLPAAKKELLSKKELKKLRQKSKKALEKQDNDSKDTHEYDSNLNESVEALIDPTKNSIDLNDNLSSDSASNNNMEPPNNMLEELPKVVPEEVDDKVVPNVTETLKTIPMPPNPVHPDGVVGWVQAEVTAVAGDSSVKQSTLPHGVESKAAVPKDPGPVNTEERKAFIEHLVHMIYELSKRNLLFLFSTGVCGPAEALERVTEDHRSELESCLQGWRDKVGKCYAYHPWGNCLPCINNEQQCISFTGAREFFKQLKDEQIENMCENFKLTFNKSARGKYEGGKIIYSLTPPWGLLGLGYSLRECFFTSDNYLSHHALGKLADRLVEKGMLAAAGEDDHRDHGSAGQQPHPVDAGSE